MTDPRKLTETEMLEKIERLESELAEARKDCAVAEKNHMDADFQLSGLMQELAASQWREKLAVEERDTIMRWRSRQIEAIRRRIDTGGLSQDEQALLDDLMLPRQYDRRGPIDGGEVDQ